MIHSQIQSELRGSENRTGKCCLCARRFAYHKLMRLHDGVTNYPFTGFFPQRGLYCVDCMNFRRQYELPWKRQLREDAGGPRLPRTYNLDVLVRPVEAFEDGVMRDQEDPNMCLLFRRSPGTDNIDFLYYLHPYLLNAYREAGFLDPIRQARAKPKPPPPGLSRRAGRIDLTSWFLLRYWLIQKIEECVSELRTTSSWLIGLLTPGGSSTEPAHACLAMEAPRRDLKRTETR